MSEFYKSLRVCKRKPAILSIILPYHRQLLKDIRKNYVVCMNHSKRISLNYLELRNLDNSLDINVSPQQQSNVETIEVVI